MLKVKITYLSPSDEANHLHHVSILANLITTIAQLPFFMDKVNKRMICLTPAFGS